MSSDSESDENDLYNSLIATSRRIAKEIEQSNQPVSPNNLNQNQNLTNNSNESSKHQSKSTYQNKRLTPIIVTESHINKSVDNHQVNDDDDLMSTPIRKTNLEIKHQFELNSPSTPSSVTSLSKSRSPTSSIFIKSLPPIPDRTTTSKLEKKIITKEKEDLTNSPIEEKKLINPRQSSNLNSSVLTPKKTLIPTPSIRKPNPTLTSTPSIRTPNPTLIPNPSINRTRVRLASMGVGIRPKTTITHRIHSINKSGTLKHQSSLQQITNSTNTTSSSTNVNRIITTKKSVSDLVAKIERDHKPSLNHQKSINLNQRNRKKSLIGLQSDDNNLNKNGFDLIGIENDENEELMKLIESLWNVFFSPSPID